MPDTGVRSLGTAVRGVLEEFEGGLLGHERLPPEHHLDRLYWQPDCPTVYCDRCGRSHPDAFRRCRACIDQRLPHHGVVRLAAYQEPMASWIRDFKFRRWESMGRLLGGRLGEACRRHLVDHQRAVDCVVPVPSPWLRGRLRGQDHCLIIAQEVSRVLERPVRSPLRQLGGLPQAHRSRSARLRRPNPFRSSYFGRSIRGRDVLLVDDVLTTGSTIRAASRVLLDLGVGRILVGVLGVSNPPRSPLRASQG